MRTHGIRFDERITIGPDWDFFTHFADVGTFGYVDRSTCLYRLHGTNISMRTGSERRRRDLAACRSNAIRMSSFANCPVDVRVWAFYDLLMNGLAHRPESRQEVLEWPQFRALPTAEQSRLLRLMASRTFVDGADGAAAARWLRESRALNPSDLRARLLLALHDVKPGALQARLTSAKGSGA